MEGVKIAHIIHFDTSVGFSNCSNKDNGNIGNNHVVLLVFRSLSVTIFNFYLAHYRYSYTDRRQTTLMLSRKHRKTIILLSFGNFQLKGIIDGVTLLKKIMLISSCQKISYVYCIFTIFVVVNYTLRRQM